MALPQTLTRSDYGTYSETISLPDWGTASAGIRYVFTRSGEESVEIEGVFDGNEAVLTVSSADSSRLVPGEWRLIRLIEEGGKRQSSIAIARVLVREDPLEQEERTAHHLP